MAYNPADYQAVERESLLMSRDKLEEYYVKDRNKRHLNCGETFFLIILILVAITFLILSSYSLGEKIIKDDISDKIVVISEEVCPLMGPGYESQELFKDSDGDLNKIVCNWENSNVVYPQRPA